MNPPTSNGLHWGLVDDRDGKRWIAIFVTEGVFGQRFFQWFDDYQKYDRETRKPVAPEIVEWKKIEPPEVP